MTRRTSFLIIAALLLVYILPLGVRPLFIPDETRYAEISREMCASGNWVVPRFDGLRYFEKPVLGYWLLAASETLFGNNNFAVRFSGATSAAVAAFAVLLLAWKCSGGGLPVAGLAAIVFLLCPLVFGTGTFAVLDGPFSMFITLALTLFFLGYAEADRRRKALFFAVFGAVSGLAFMTKGFLGFALPVIIIIPFMLWERQVRELFRFPWMPLGVAILVVLPWSIMIHLREGDFWNYFFWVEHVQRYFAPVSKAQHHEPFWFFGPVFLGGALPWMFLLPAVFSGLRKTGLKHPLVRFCLAWTVLVLVIFSCSQGKLGTYILPCFAPLALLVAMGLTRYLDTGRTRWFTGGILGLAGLLCLIGFVMIAVQTLPFRPDWRLFDAEETWKWALGAAGIFVWVLLITIAAWVKSARLRLPLFCMAPLLFMSLLPIILPTAVVNGRAPEALLLRNAGRIPPKGIVACTPSLVGAVCWSYRRTDIYLAGTTGECAYGLEYDDAGHRSLSLDDIRRKKRRQNGELLTIIMNTSTYDIWKSELPEPVYLDRTSGFVFVQF